MESVSVLVVVLVGVMLLQRGAAAGSVLAWYLVAYDLVRFGLEFLRGDDDRPYLWGFSQAQWLALTLTALVATAEVSGWLPLRTWHLLAASGLIVITAALAGLRHAASARGSLPRHRLLDAVHISELAAAIDTLAVPTESTADDIMIARTSAGLTLSRGAMAAGVHYTVSREHGVDQGTARRLAGLIAQLRHPRATVLLVPGISGMYHLVFEGDCRCPA